MFEEFICCEEAFFCVGEFSYEGNAILHTQGVDTWKLVKRGFVGEYVLGVSSGKSEIMRYSNHLFDSSIAFKRALFDANKVSVISGSSVTIAKV